MTNSYQYIIRLLLFQIGLYHLPVQAVGQAKLDTLSLQQLIQTAQQQSFSKTEAQWYWQQAELEYGIFRASLKPQVSAFANFPNFSRTSQETIQPDGTLAFQSISYNNSVLGMRLEQPLAATGGRLFIQSDLQRFDDFNNDKKSYNGVPLRIGISQPLFGFNRWKWSKLVEPLRYREAEQQYQFDLESINRTAADLFFDLLLNHTNLEIARANKSSNQSLFKIAQKRYDLGNLSYSDLMRIRLELISATKNERRAEQAMELASAALYTFLGLQHQREVIIPRLPEVTDSTVIDHQLALQQALANRFEITSFQRTMIEADRDIAAAKGNGGFQASLVASFGWTRSGSSFGEIYQNPQQEQLVQVQLNIPILDWGQQKTTVALAKAQKTFLQEKIQQDKTELLTEVQQAIIQFENLQEQLVLTKQLRDIARERFEISKESYLLGAISLTDLTLAQREKDQTVREYMDTLSLYWKNYYLLRNLTLYEL